MSKRFWTIGLASVLLVATPAASLAAKARFAGANPIPQVHTHYTEQSARYVAVMGGPANELHGDVGGITMTKRFRFHFTSPRDAYRAMVTVSLDYRGSAGDTFAFEPRIREGGHNSGPTTAGTTVERQIKPGPRPLPATRTGSTTMQWLVTGLQSDTNYDLTFLTKLDHSGGRDGFSIRTSHLVVTVERL